VKICGRLRSTRLISRGRVRVPAGPDQTRESERASEQASERACIIWKLLNRSMLANDRMGARPGQARPAKPSLLLSFSPNNVQQLHQRTRSVRTHQVPTTGNVNKFKARIEVQATNNIIAGVSSTRPSIDGSPPHADFD